jgi:hypothetical protein
VSLSSQVELMHILSNPATGVFLFPHAMKLPDQLGFSQWTRVASGCKWFPGDIKLSEPPMGLVGHQSTILMHLD